MYNPLKLAKEIEDIICDPTTPRDKDNFISIAAPFNEWAVIIAKLRINETTKEK